MKRVLVLGGTSESHPLLQWLDRLGVQTTLSVATDYGRSCIAPRAGLTVVCGRLDTKGLCALLQADGGFDCAVDATHPYAVQVSENLAAACRATQTPLLRLLRPPGDLHGCVCVASVAEAVTWLNKNAPPEAVVMAATGAKELAAFAALQNVTRRCVARVLPMPEALAQCAALGLPPAHIVAMQGPFSQPLNAALFAHYGVGYLVTKDGGAAGGFAEKKAAAAACGVTVVAVTRPVEQGLDWPALQRQLDAMLGQ